MIALARSRTPRRDGGIAFAEALKSNTNLVDLNLEKCSLGDEGAEAVGKALQINKTLRFLYLSDIGLSEDMKKRLRFSWGDRDGSLSL
jgi:Ran GTPase-activating protein (RanGAP) involved in mRNA processing and transport